MSQNRNKLLELFIAYLANAILHQLLNKATNNEEIGKKYREEIQASLRLAQKYRNQINPLKHSLPEADVLYIHKKLMNRVRTRLSARIGEGYTNLSPASIEEFVEAALKELKII